jgi:sulfite reductase (NADPH) flavoprotein alpha-component
VVPQNPIEIVEAIIDTLGIDASLPVNFKNENYTIHDLLKYKINIIFITERLVKLYADKVQQDIPIAKMNLLDLVKIYPPASIEQFVEIVTQFNAISPRLYTIASAPSAHENEIHLLVVKDKYMVDNALHFGLCSNYLSGLTVGNIQQFFIQSNKRFRLPAPNKDCVMIGPGTGIAAFRSFLAEREVTGATGKNWLFFGEQHFATDFLYQTQIQQWVETGMLSKINVAFSRDQAEKIYVQHKMMQHAQELFNWIQNGAYVFVCGNKNRMSVEVEKTLLQIFQQQANFTEAQAYQYLEQLETEGRYEKDVY